MRETFLSPWPDDALRFGRAVERVGRLIVAARRGFSSTWDLTIAGWRMLQLVSEADGDFTLAAMAWRLGIARASAHATAAGLRRLEMLELRFSPEDRRVRRLAMTDHGEECLSELNAAIQMLILEVTSGIPRESLKTTAALLERMARRLRRCESALRYARHSQGSQPNRRGRRGLKENR